MGGLGVAAEKLFRSPQALVCPAQREEFTLLAKGNFTEPELAHGAASQNCGGKLSLNRKGGKERRKELWDGEDAVTCSFVES